MDEGPKTSSGKNNTTFIRPAGKITVKRLLMSEHGSPRIADRRTNEKEEDSSTVKTNQEVVESKSITVREISTPISCGIDNVEDSIIDDVNTKPLVTDIPEDHDTE